MKNVTSKMSADKADRNVLDAATTRARLELMWGRAFDPEARAFYKLEALWKNAPVVLHIL